MLLCMLLGTERNLCEKISGCSSVCVSERIKESSQKREHNGKGSNLLGT
jgi:hypothetical protein